MRLVDVVAILDGWFPPDLAESWDAVGLTFGDPQAAVSRVLVAVDPSPAVAQQALDEGPDLVVTHHPLWLSGVTALRGAKGDLAQKLIAGGVALYNAHTNADRAPGGVNDALAAAIGLRDTRPLEQLHDEVLRVTVYVPTEHREALIDALAAAGAGTIGEYDRCGYSTSGTGTFRPLAGADPHIGQVGRIEVVDEDRLEMVLPAGRRDDVVAALLTTHPYEEPAYDFTVVTRARRQTGLGRVGQTDEQSLAQFAGLVAGALPATAGGVRFAGDPQAMVRTVAVLGGSGGSELAAASRQADVFVTSDLKHHPVEEHIAGGGCAVVDVAHWASEWPWCPVTADRLNALGLEASASAVVTDPWTGHAGGGYEG